MSSTLEDHEEVCAQRYADIERRLTSVEDKVSSLSTEMNENFRRNTNMMITGFGLVISVIGIIGTFIGLAL